jgi:SAM-dependent methyltransferase
MGVRQPWPVARSLQRQRELGALFGGVPSGVLGDALEIGGGDGFVASLVAKYCRSFITTDPFRPRLATASPGSGVRRLVCDATTLPFRDASFDLIFSSSVLEHIRDRGPVFAEMARCLRPGGIMIHIMPSRTWKLFQLLFYYPHLFVGALDILVDKVVTRPKPRVLPGSACAAEAANRWSDQRVWGRSLRTIVRWSVPRVHGEFAGHWSEWLGFGARSWASEFQSASFNVQRVLLLPLYSGYGFGLHRLRSMGERFGLSSHNAFILTKCGEKPDVLDCFEKAPAPALSLPSPSPLPSSGS